MSVRPSDRLLRQRPRRERGGGYVQTDWPGPPLPDRVGTKHSDFHRCILPRQTTNKLHIWEDCSQVGLRGLRASSVLNRCVPIFPSTTVSDSSMVHSEAPALFRARNDLIPSSVPHDLTGTPVLLIPPRQYRNRGRGCRREMDETRDIVAQKKKMSPVRPGLQNRLETVGLVVVGEQRVLFAVELRLFFFFCTRRRKGCCVET